MKEIEEQELDNSLIIKDEESSEGKDVAMWFSKDVFEDVEDGMEAEGTDDEDETSDDDDEYAKKEILDVRKEEKETNSKKRKAEALLAKQNSKRTRTSTAANPADAVEEDSTFEVVPQEHSDESSEEESEFVAESDPEEAATSLALAKKMSKSKKRKRDMIDSGYNRWMWNDPEDLPDWFADAEKKHNKPIAPITKEEFEAMKQYALEINARPIKKVAEAKARKKRRV